jgi:hypothetical protein
MKLVRALLFTFLAALLAPSDASACSYPKPVEFNEAVEGSTSIFVMRVHDAKLIDSTQAGTRPFVRAEIEIIEELLGSARHFRYTTFDNLPCGGVRLDVGHYYLVFTHQAGDTLRLVPADQSVLNITVEYVPGSDQQNHNRKLFASTLAFIRGEATADAIDPFPFLERTGVAERIDCNLCP